MQNIKKRSAKSEGVTQLGTVKLCKNACIEDNIQPVKICCIKNVIQIRVQDWKMNTQLTSKKIGRPYI